MARLRIAVTGATGRMGRAVLAVVLDDPAAELVAAVGRPGGARLALDAGTLAGRAAAGVPVTDDLDRAVAASEVVIDFSVAAHMSRVVESAARARRPVVTGTTGLDANARDRLAALARDAPVVAAPNMSVGANLLLGLASAAVRALGPEYDAEIVELHHRMKRDAPSGTALALGEAVARAQGRTLSPHARFAREGSVGPRPSGEIGILAARGGDVVGDHTLYLLGAGERIELHHQATSREPFARGAVRAAHWLAGRAPGLYDMLDVLGLR